MEAGSASVMRNSYEKQSVKNTDKISNLLFFMRKYDRNVAEKTLVRLK